MDFETIEDKIISTLKDEVKYLRTVQTYAGQLEGEIEKLPIGFPAAFVVYGGSSFEWVDGPNHNEKTEFSVLVAAKNLRGGAVARKGGAAPGGKGSVTPGAYDMVKDVLSALVNKDFGLDMERLRPVRTSLVFTNRTVTVYGIDFKTGFDKTYE